MLALSHLACADEPAHPMNRRQAEAFAGRRPRLPGVRLSLAATGGILLGPGFHLGLTRPGIGLYGGLPFAAARPVVSLALPVIQVRDVAPGESGGLRRRLDRRRAQPASPPSPPAMPTACCARSAAAASRLFAGDIPCPLVGRVSMDLITADVTDLRGGAGHTSKS